MKDMLLTPEKQSAPEHGQGHLSAPVSVVPDSLLRLHQSAGNRAVSSLFQGGNGASSALEVEADAAADQVMARAGNEMTGGSFGSGRLDGALRRGLEAGFGKELGDLRLHTDAAAGAVNKDAGTNAFTVGNDIYLGEERSSLDTPEALHTLAHEVAHAVQQGHGGSRFGGAEMPVLSAAPPGLQADPAEGSAAAPITARTILPFPEGSRVVLNRILPDMWFQLLQSLEPEVAAAAQAIDRLVMNVSSATDDLVEASSSEPVALPAMGKTPAKTYTRITLSLRRSQAGKFDFILVGVEGDAKSETLFELRGLTARRDGAAVVLEDASGATPVPHLRLTPGEGGQLKAEAFTAPYLSEIPESLRGLAPERIDLLQLSRLPDAPAGSQEEKAAVERIASSASAGRGLPSQRLSAGFGGAWAPGINPLLNVSWQMIFRPSRVAGGFFQTPLEVQLLYVPPLSGLIGVGTAADLTLAPLEIPINIRITAGVAGGALYGTPESPGAARPLRGAFGPTFGGAAGLEFDTFRVNIRYDRLVNLVNNSPDANLLLLRFEKAF